MWRNRARLIHLIMKSPGRFGRNIISNASGNLLVSALQVALIPVLFTFLDAPVYAAFITAGYLIGLMEIASDYGGRLWATREFSVADNPRAVLQLSVRTKLFYTIVSVCILSFLPSNKLPLEGFLLSALIAATQPSTDPFLWFMRGRERLDVEAVVVFVSRLAIVVGMALAAVAGADLVTLLLIWLTGNLSRMIVESRLAITRPLLDGSTADVVQQKTLQTISTVFPFGTALVMTCIFQRTSLWLLDCYASVAEYNIYATAFKFVNTAGTIATSIFVSSFAPLTKAIEAGDQMAIRSVIRRKMILVTVVFLPACLLGILLIGPLSGLVESASVNDVAGVMVLLMPGLYVSCVNMGLKYTLNAWKLNWQDVGAVAVGIIALCAATVFHGQMNWWTAGAVGWFVGESALLAGRLGLLRSQKKHRGVPIGMICGSAAALLVLVVLRS